MPRPDAARRERVLAVAAFAVTCATVFVVHAVGWQPVGDPWAAMGRAWLFTAALMGILLVHELGHVLAARRHGLAIGWPLFLPFPLLVGTLGAVIRLRESPRSRLALLEIGALGPLVGLVAAFVVALAWAAAGPLAPAPDGLVLQTPLALHAAHLVVCGTLAPGVSSADPLGFAAWIGCFVTALNLMPIGQLDGGHVAAALAPRKARAVGWITTGVLLAAGLWWPGWAAWAAVVHFLGARDPVVVRDQRPSPSGWALALGSLATLALILTVTPAPIGWAVTR